MARSYNNNDRARFAHHACLQYLLAKGDNKSAYDAEEVIGDLFGDLLHMARANGLDPAAVLQGKLDRLIEEEVGDGGRATNGVW